MTPLAVALGAALLFVCEPAAGKTILPWLGGTPAAWGATLLFFQVALIAGYGLVDQAQRRGGTRAVAVVHVVVVVLAGVVLATGVPFAGGRAPEAATISGTLGILLLEIGAPVVALALTAPALQAWSAAMRGEQGRKGYSLYAASNTGSLVGLLSYPWLVEPAVGLSMQWQLWRIGFWVFVASVVLLWYGVRHRLAAAAARPRSEPPPAPARVFAWFARAAIPAALLASVTAYLTRDLAPIPMLWVIPLALYLATWIVAFSGRATGIVTWAAKRQDLVAVVAAIILLRPPTGLMNGIIALGAMVVVCIAQHGALAASAPAESQLGRFYVWLAAGGAVGTGVVVVLGPMLLSVPVEAPLALAAAVALGRPPLKAWSLLGTTFYVAVAAVAALAPFVMRLPSPGLASLTIFAGAIVIALRGWPRVGGVVLAAMALATGAAEVLSPRHLASTHGVLGRFIVRSDRAGKGLISGSTLHGYELRADSAVRPRPTMYYTYRGPYGDLVGLLDRQQSPGWSFGVVGLGVGSLGCTASPGTRVTYFEINPGVVRLARDTTLFRSLSVCAPDAVVRLGDARLTLSREPTRFDFLTIDAFNSDAIPTHLLTREAFGVYRARMTPGGVIAFHLSNRYLDLVPVAAGLARDAGWVSVATRASVRFELGPERGVWSTVVASAADSTTLAPLVASGRWDWVDARHAPVWTDDWTPLAKALHLTRENFVGR